MQAQLLYSLDGEDGDVDHYYLLKGAAEFLTKEQVNEWAESHYYHPRCAGQDFMSRHSAYAHTFNGTWIVVLHEELDI